MGRSKVAKGGTKRSIAGVVLDQEQIEYWKGKFRRMCEPKRASGNIEVPKDVFEKYQAKGATREKLFEAFIKTGGEKD